MDRSARRPVARSWVRVPTGNFKWLVGCCTALGILAPVAHWAISPDSGLWSNLVAEFFGLGASVGLVYLVIDRKLEEERRARRKPVENKVLKRVFQGCYLIITLTWASSSSPSPDTRGFPPAQQEDPATSLALADRFSKGITTEGIRLADTGNPVMNRLLYTLIAQELDRLLRLQQNYPFVFEAYQNIVNAMMALEDTREFLDWRYAQLEGMGSMPVAK